jgi:hypothetical protein
MKGTSMNKLLAVLLLCLPRLALAAGSVSFSTQAINQGNTAYIVTINWTGDASTGSVPTTTITGLAPVQGYQITQIQTVPGTPSPTASYSITVKDVNGYDMAGGQATSLSATAAASFATTSATPPIVGALSFALTGNSVASAKGKVILYIFKPSVLAAANLLGRYGAGGGDVDSVFGRTGAVTATSGDYTASQVTNVPAGGIAATDVQAAITELDTEKQATGNYLTALTGDATASGPGSAALTLATVNSNTGACGDATHVCQVTLNAKGLATAATPVSISAAGTVTVVGGGSLTSTALVTGGGSQTLQTPAATATMDTSGNISTPGTVSAAGVSVGTSPPTCTAGTAGVWCGKEGTAPTGEAGVGELYWKTDHLLYANPNNAGEVQVPTASSTATLTNKTFDTAGTGNSFKINGTAITSVSGTGAVCLETGSACSGTAYNPLDFRNPSFSFRALSTARYDPGAPVRYETGCSGGTGAGATGSTTVALTPWQFYATAGTTSDNCWMVYPNSNNGSYGFGFTDVFSGSSPKRFQIKAVMKLQDRNGDVMLAVTNQPTDGGSGWKYDSFGCIARKTDTNWQAYISNAGSVTYADTGVAVTSGTGDSDGAVQLEVNNGTGPTANAITCKVNGTSATASATIPSTSPSIIFGEEENGASAATWAYTWFGWQFWGIGSVE